MIPPLETCSPNDCDQTRLAWAAWPADLVTPVAACAALRAAGLGPCLLESVEGPERLARYTFVGVTSRASFRSGPRGARVREGGVERALPGGTLQALRALAAERPAARPPRGLPPFCGGWVGWFGFEWAAELEPVVGRAARDPWGDDDVLLERFDEVLAFDHAAQKLYAVGACPGGEGERRAVLDRLHEHVAIALTPPPAGGGFVLAGRPESTTAPETFRAGVRQVREAIRAGECFQAVLSQRFEVEAEGDPFALYRVLRLTNPSPHLFFFEADGVSLIGSSPERLVAARGGALETHPIAGTRPRGADQSEDEALARALASSPKECAEHDMLVDLARNDLGRVARIGSVAVREHRRIERFARVQHLVSRVEARLAAGHDALDALAATFPAGTVSGAPKLRALQLVAELEPETRGPYGGCFGYLDGAGALDMALTIRTFVHRRGVLSVQAGAGVVFDSDPESERLETCHKAQALFDAARLVQRETFGARREEVPA